MVFITPMVIKLIHPHKTQQVVLFYNTHKTFVKGIERCLICQFEFVNIISNNSEKPFSDSQNILILLSSGQTSRFLNISHRNFSKRAPPPTLA